MILYPANIYLSGKCVIIVWCYRYYAGWADKNHGKTVPVCKYRNSFLIWKTLSFTNSTRIQVNCTIKIHRIYSKKNSS